MRIAVVSDIHGNLEALDATLDRLSGLGVSRIVCLGDVVGYGADPNACVEAVRKRAEISLAGNHDWAAVGLEDTEYFNPIALAAIRWTSTSLTAENASWLKHLPLMANEGEAQFVHASPDRPETWPYISDHVEARWALAASEARVCFVGHSHVAFACAERGPDEVTGEGSMRLTAGDRYLVNAGSVGQPRDSDPRAAFAVWDREADEVHLHRVDYDLPRAQGKIREAGLPEMLAERLAEGW